MSRLFSEALYRRIAALFSACTLGAAGLTGRLYTLVNSDEIAPAAANQSQYTLSVSDERAKIYDAHFSPITGAASGRFRTAVFPSSVSASELTALLRTVPDEKKESVFELYQSGKPFVTETEADVSGRTLFSFPISDEDPSDQPAVHLIGYLDYEGKGVSGLQKGYEDYLSENGRRIEITGKSDALSRTIAGETPEIRITGSESAGLVLTLDLRLQKAVETIGERMLQKGAVVLMDPFTGQIRAMASFPSYSPADIPAALADTENAPLLNRALLSYSVGSTFKIVTAAAAMETLGHKACLERKYTCLGAVDVHGQLFRCHLRSGHGELDLFDAFQLSCNPWFITLGLETGGSAVLKTAKAFGFGESLRLADGITVSSGALPDENELSAPAASANLSFGQGFLLASPVQIARMLSAVVNGGKLVSPTLILGKTEDGRTLIPEADVLPRRVIDEKTAAQLKAIVSYAVMADVSSGAKPQKTTAGGKTATAQTGQTDENGNEVEHGWFAGFFPADDPQLVCVVLAENAGFGNRSAAPVFAAIADAAAEILCYW